MVLSASAYTSLVDYGSVWTIFERQVLWMALGGIAMFAAAKIRYDRWRRVRVLAACGHHGAARRRPAPWVGVVAGGSSRWIGFGLLRIQPSELMKLALAIFAADLLARRAHRMRSARAVVLPLLLILAIAAAARRQTA